MVAASTDYFTKVGTPGTATTLSAPGHSIGGTTFNVGSTANWPTDTGVVFAVDQYTLQTVNGQSNVAVRTPGTYTEWEGVVSGSTQISSATLRYGTDQNYPAGANTRVYIPVSSSRENRIVDGLLAAGIQQNGTMGNITPTSVTSATGTFTNLIVGSQTPSADWTATTAPNTVTYNGNHSYTLVINGSDITGAVNPGTRLRTTRTVAAPTQSTSLNGTNQNYVKTSPSGMGQTDNITVMQWLRPTAYQGGHIQAKTATPGTDGWRIYLDPQGRVNINGNGRYSNSYQSLPLNRWTHVAVTLSMSTSTVNMYLDGVLVPSTALSGTGTSFTNAGNYYVGGIPSVEFYAGAIAQVGFFSSVLSQATIQNYISQGFIGNETNVVSAYSFSGSINDLNTTNANNLTANNGAVATNASSPFGSQAGGTISSTLDYGIIQSSVFSTNTTLVVQVPEGCTIPTTGGVTALSYSSAKAPYGFPSSVDRWTISVVILTTINTSGTTTSTWYNPGGVYLQQPVGKWNTGYSAAIQTNHSGVADFFSTLSTSATTATSPDLTARDYVNAGSIRIVSPYRKTSTFSSTMTPYYFLLQNGGSFTSMFINATTTAAHIMFAENAHI